MLPLILYQSASPCHSIQFPFLHSSFFPSSTHKPKFLSSRTHPLSYLSIQSPPPVYLSLSQHHLVSLPSLHFTSPSSSPALHISCSYLSTQSHFLLVYFPSHRHPVSLPPFTHSLTRSSLPVLYLLTPVPFLDSPVLLVPFLSFPASPCPPLSVSLLPSSTHAPPLSQSFSLQC